MKITQVETIQAQMVEFDGDVRYLRIKTPGEGGTNNWFVPIGDSTDNSFRFVLVPLAQNIVLEAAFMQHIGITQ